jgi:hypothetical protein
MIVRFDEAVARATTLLAAGDADAATAAIDTARAIDPAAPVVNELSARLVNQFKSRAETARKGSPAPSPPARAPLPQPPAANDAARRESQRPSVPADPPSATPPPAPPTPAPQAAAPAPPVAPSNSGTQPAITVPPAPSASIAPPPPVQPEPSPSVREPAAPSSAPSGGRRETAAPPSANDSDDTAIRRVVATYARAIETKDVALFRSIKPNMTPEEQRRIEEGFRAVSSQRVAITILTVNRKDQEASVRLKRSDTIDAAGRQQTIDTQQTMTLIRSGPAWIIRDIGR